MEIDFSIDNNFIENSFDRIAKDLLLRYSLIVNNKKFQITEIEFYYYYEGFHEDNYTHKHKRNEGEWRFHSQGLDITLKGGENFDGGILIRGISLNGEYVNGPRKILNRIFENFSMVTESNFFTLKRNEERFEKIIKTFRHIPNKTKFEAFHKKNYRYLVKLDVLDISNSIKKAIQENHIEI